MHDSYGLFRVMEGEGKEVVGITVEGRIIPVKGGIRAKQGLDALQHGVIRVTGGGKGVSDEVVDNLVSLGLAPPQSTGGGDGGLGSGAEMGSVNRGLNLGLSGSPKE